MTDNYIKTKKILELYAPSSVRAKIKRARKVGKYVGGTTGGAAALALPIPGSAEIGVFSGAKAGSKAGGRWVGARAIAKDKGTKIKSIRQIKDAGKIAKSTTKAGIGYAKHIVKSAPGRIRKIPRVIKSIPSIAKKLPGIAKKLSKYAMTKRLLRTG